MNENQKKAFVILIFSYFVFIIAMVLNLYWSKSSEVISNGKDIFMRVLYLLFCIMAISSFVTIAKENMKSKAPIKNLLFPSFLVILPTLILVGQVVSFISILST